MGLRLDVPAPARRVGRQSDERPEILDRQLLRAVSGLRSLVGAGTTRREGHSAENHERADGDPHDGNNVTGVFQYQACPLTRG